MRRVGLRGELLATLIRGLRKLGADLGGSTDIHMTIQGDPGVLMEGNYWTGRKTTGTMTFDRKIAHLCGTFAEAEERFKG